MVRKCGICDSEMWTVASAKFTKRETIEKKLVQQFGTYNTYFDQEFDYYRIIKIPDFDQMLSTLEDCLKKLEIERVTFMPRGWWIRCDHYFELSQDEISAYEQEISAVKFDDVSDAMKFLKANMVYGTVFEYYVMDDKFQWMVTICKDMEMHFCGSSEFFKQITDYDEGAAEDST